MMHYFLAQVSRDDINIPKGGLEQSSVNATLTIVFAVFAGIAVIIITLSALKYVLSQGNPQETAKAKNTIIYALIGLVVSVFAFSIVRFVLRSI